MIQFNNIDLAFDIGAYDGGYTNGLLERGVQRVVCIEANPHTLNRLLDRYHSNPRVVVVHAAASNTSGDTLDFFVSRKHPTISTASPDWKTNSRFTDNRDESGVQYEWEETAPTKTVSIDELIERHGTPKFIKVDVEGYEHEVVRGLTTMLPDTCITLEFAEECTSSIQTGLDHLNALGFSSFGMIEGDDIDRYPNRFHTYDAFTKKIDTAFPSTTREFFGTVFVKP